MLGQATYDSVCSQKRKCCLEILTVRYLSGHLFDCRQHCEKYCSHWDSGFARLEEEGGQRWSVRPPLPPDSRQGDGRLSGRRGLIERGEWQWDPPRWPVLTVCVRQSLPFRILLSVTNAPPTCISDAPLRDSHAPCTGVGAGTWPNLE